MLRGRPPRSVVPLVAIATAVAACGPVPGATGEPDDGKARSGTRVAASPAAGVASPPASAGSPGPSLSPGASSSDSSPGPRPSGVPASPLPRLARIESKLLLLAKVSFGQNRNQRASEKVFDGATGAALLGDQGASVISNNGSGLISDNGGSVVSNNGGSVISNNGGAYRLAQAVPSPAPSPPPDATIAVTPVDGETQTARRLYPDGFAKLEFQAATASGEPAIRTVLLSDGKPVQQSVTIVVERYANAAKSKKVSETVLTSLYGEGRFAVKLVSRAEHDEAGRMVRTQYLPGSFTHDKATGAFMFIEQLAFDLPLRKATFRYRYAAFGLTEEGSLQDMALDSNGAITIAFWDPIALDDGDSVVTDEAGARVYTKRQRRVGSVVTRDFDFGDGITLSLRRVDVNHFAGRLSESGVATADVALESRADGSAVFTITFDDAKDRPVTIGYGLAGEGAAAPPSRAPTFYTTVTTVAGADDAGKADGPSAAARFNKPTAIACAAPNPAAFFVADAGNHIIRRASLAEGTFTTYAGDGTPGHRDGARSQAQFNLPGGLAVGADETVYVADTADHRIRVIAPDGQVSTLAGDGTAGTDDGTGAAARFDRPSGLALDAAGRLYVADTGNQLIRRIETSGAEKGRVTAVAGSPDAAGLADGTGLAARFNGPTGLAVGPDGAVYVADKESRRIRRVTPEGVVTTIAGTDDLAARGFDGPALASGLEPPVSLAFDPAGVLHVATEKDIRSLTPGGELRTVAGPHVWSIDGAPFDAGFARCAGLAFLPNGIAMVVDRYRIRWILPPAFLKEAAEAQRAARP